MTASNRKRYFIFTGVLLAAAVMAANPARAQFPTGACCLSNGTCVTQTQIGCAVVGGRYKGNGVSCSSVDCTGACCSTLVSACTDGHTSESCADFFGHFLGPETSCTEGACLGGCCLGSSCQEGFSQAGCGSLLGAFLGFGSDCTDVVCTGACCLRTGGCVTTYALDCDGRFFGRGSLCADVDCSGACCLDDGSCTQYTSESSCEIGSPFGPGGLWKGIGSSCATATCDPAGACCYSNGECSQLTSAACSDAGGTYRGDDTQCAETCLGACCLGDGQCINATSIGQCLVLGGQYAGDGITCDESCTGACCVNDETCIAGISAYTCNALPDGIYQGDGSRCQDGQCPYLACPGTGPCCVDNGSPGCESLSCCETVCAAEPSCCQNEWGPHCASLAQTLCQSYCTGSGRCCRPDASCVVESSAADCAAQSGRWGGGGTNCLLADCTSGACCKDDGTCVDRTNRLACSLLYSGEHRGHGTTCDRAFCGQCPGTGNCCLEHATGGCASEDCCLSVCTADPFCCNETWDDVCAGEAADLCGGGAYCSDTGKCCRPNGTCANLQTEAQCDAAEGRWSAGGICTVGACTYGACCLDNGDCQGDTLTLSCTVIGGAHQGVGTTCSEVECPACAGDGDCCVANGSPGCNDRGCCRMVSAVAPSCGTVVWDELCADLAAHLCGDADGLYCGECPATGDCCNPHEIPGCEQQSCCDQVCAMEPYCCSVEWDNLCAAIARRLCTEFCDMEEIADVDLDGDVDLQDAGIMLDLFTGPR